jgi:hypothetical protein
MASTQDLLMLHLRTLGELRLEGTAAPALSSRRKELVLLAYLARRSPRPLARMEAAALLWPERDERRARQSLRQALLELRHLVGDGLISSTWPQARSSWMLRCSSGRSTRGMRRRSLVGGEKASWKPRGTG